MAATSLTASPLRPGGWPPPAEHDTVRVGWQGTSYLWGPLVAFAAVAGLVLILRWSARPGASLIPKPPRLGPPDDYGALVPVAAPATETEGRAIVRRLTAAGVRATAARTTSGYRVYVWPRDEARAVEVLASG